MEQLNNFSVFLKKANDQFVENKFYTSTDIEKQIFNIYQQIRKKDKTTFCVIYSKILSLYSEKTWPLPIRSLLEEFLSNFSSKKDKSCWLKKAFNGYFEEVINSLENEILKNSPDRVNAALRKLWHIAFLLKKYSSMLNINEVKAKLTSLIEKAFLITPNLSSYDPDCLYSLIYLAAFSNLSSLPSFLKLLIQVRNKNHNIYKILLAPSHPPLLFIDFFPVYIFDSQDCWKEKEKKNTLVNLSEAVKNIDLQSVKEEFFDEERSSQFFDTCRLIINHSSDQQLQNELKNEVPSEENKYWKKFIEKSSKNTLSSGFLFSSHIPILISPIEQTHSLKDTLNILCKFILNHAQLPSYPTIFEYLIPI